jgi:hypothetical protein
MLLFGFAAKRFRHQMIEHVLPDLAAKSAAYQSHRSFTGTEAGQLRPFLHVGKDMLRLPFDLVNGYGDLDLVFTTLNKWHRSPSLGVD